MTPSGTKKTLSLVGDRAAVTGLESLGCGHCAAVCPEGAVSVAGLECDLELCSDLSLAPSEAPFGPSALQALFRRRRSCRLFTKQEVSEAALRDLVRMAITAPSGTNSQRWTFTLLKNRARVQELAQLVAAFYEKVNALCARPAVRAASRLFGKGVLDRYYHEHYATVAQALE